MDKVQIRMEIYMGLSMAFNRPRRRMFAPHSEHSLIKIFSPHTKKYLLSVSPKCATDFFAFIEKNAEKDDSIFWREFEIEYNRLFGGPFPPQAYPNESSYWNSHHPTVNQWVLRICEVYAQEGFMIKSTFNALPDHIIAELEFMAILCEREREARQNDENDKVLQYLLKQYEFLVEHLCTWIPDFSRRIQSNTGASFYLALAALLRDFILDDLEGVREEIFKLEIEVSNPRIVSHAVKGVTHLGGGRVEEERAGFKVEINSPDCILCAACLSSCPTKAYRITHSRQSVRLFFNAELCNGCKQCVAACPQQAILLSPEYHTQQTGQKEQWVEIARAKPAKCPGCGQVDYSDKMRQRIRASFSKAEDKEALIEMLSLCDRCKKERFLKSYLKGKDGDQVIKWSRGASS